MYGAAVFELRFIVMKLPGKILRLGKCRVAKHDALVEKTFAAGIEFYQVISGTVFKSGVYVYFSIEVFVDTKLVVLPAFQRE
jgi:hypothetical protein